MVLAPLAALAAVPPALETAGDVKCERQSVEHAADLPVTPGKTPDARNPDRVLGAAVEPVSRLLAVHLPALLAANQGLLVTDVAPGSPAAAAGIALDDILHSCNAVPLLDSRTLLESWDEISDAGTLVLGVIRKGILYVAKLTPQNADEQRPASARATVDATDTRATATARSVVIRSGEGQIAIVSTDDVTFDVRVATPDSGEHHFTGSRQEIIGQIRALPERLRAHIERTLGGQGPRPGGESESRDAAHPAPARKRFPDARTWLGFEIRSTRSETNPESQYQRLEARAGEHIGRRWPVWFGTLGFRALNSFRILGFGFQVSDFRFWVLASFAAVGRTVGGST